VSQRRTLGTNDVRYEYDALGRIAAVYERDRKTLEWRYGPMDVDAATALAAGSWVELQQLLVDRERVLQALERQ